jgi:segregation and condensation protein B
MPMMETLAIVAYKQPVTRASVEFIRGVDCSHILRTLLQRKLVRVIGRELLPGRPSLYGTSKTFLEVFGLTHLKNLPLLAELDLDKDEDGNQLELPLDSDSSAEASSAPD